MVNKTATDLLAAVLALSACTAAQAACKVTSPICGEGSTLCPHNMCTKPDGGKCNLSGDGCLDIRWNRDGCLSPENTCGSGYCGTPPNFSDCFCDNGTCLAVGEKTPETEVVPTSIDGAVSTVASSVSATEAAVLTTIESVEGSTAATTVSSESSESAESSTAATDGNAVSTESSESYESGEGSTTATEATLDGENGGNVSTAAPDGSLTVNEPVGSVDASTEQFNGALAKSSSLIGLTVLFGVVVPHFCNCEVRSFSFKLSKRSTKRWNLANVTKNYNNLPSQWRQAHNNIARDDIRNTNTTMIATAIAVVISLLSCVQTQAVECTTTYPICGEGSTLCPHNMCAKPNGFCNRQGDGCVDIRFNRDGCLSPENTCGGGYCGTPPDFSDCACDNGTCIAVGPQNTFATTSASPSASLPKSRRNRRVPKSQL
ncbi:hypothetical protein ACHAWO_011721 [Cyclotella atomus]|uniref:Uncharacterized protein n=1 Tax=Cyclotella atomus TaxID=382360 RepID=A0ABD3MPF0_9STRA